MTDHFYVSQQFYDELIAQDPTYADTAIVSDKVEGYNVWSESNYKMQEAIDNLKGDLMEALEPVLWPVVDRLAKLCNWLGIK